MISDFSTHKWKFGAVFLLLIIATGCYLYYHYTTEPYRQEAIELEKRMSEWNVNKKTEPSTTADSESPQIPVERITHITEKPLIKDVTAEVENHTESGDTTDAKKSSERTLESADVAVSPFGFGPYPQLPDGWPDDTFPTPSAEHELQKRVRIKLLSQGVPVEGTFMENGLVYPVIKGTVYVSWKSYWRPTGKVTYISRIGGHPDDTFDLEMKRREKVRSFTKKDIPSNIKLLSFEEDGIDPYQFLGLPSNIRRNK